MVAKNNKFNAVKTEVDGIIFASKLEAKTYTSIKALGFDDVICQHSVTVYEGNGIVPKISWKVDFYIPCLKIYVESKGMVTRDFRFLMYLLGIHKPNVLQQLIFISSSHDDNFLLGKPALNTRELRRLLSSYVKPKRGV
jgi:hypothetical protein